MGIESIPQRYVVHIPQGMSVSDAVAQHRDRTGHGGMCVLVFEGAPTCRYRLGASRLFERDPLIEGRKINRVDANGVASKRL